MCFEENCCLLGMGLIILFQFQRSVIMQVWFHTDSKGKKRTISYDVMDTNTFVYCVLAETQLYSLINYWEVNH